MSRRGGYEIKGQQGAGLGCWSGERSVRWGGGQSTGQGATGCVDSQRLTVVRGSLHFSTLSFAMVIII